MTPVDARAPQEVLPLERAAVNYTGISSVIRHQRPESLAPECRRSVGDDRSIAQMVSPLQRCPRPGSAAAAYENARQRLIL
jgi:hypothetical protein